jgi:hypothetical protein
VEVILILNFELLGFRLLEWEMLFSRFGLSVVAVAMLIKAEMIVFIAFLEMI